MSMLRKVDTLYGHVVEDTASGPVYRDDGSPVDFDNPRPCLACGVRIERGAHDPCIANLPGTYQACCGHGLSKTEGSVPAGYVALKDGRCIRFSGCLGARRIREVVDLALKGAPLPPEVQVDEERAWWEGLTDAQRNYVQQNVSRGLSELVREATNGEQTAERFLKGEIPWWEGLTYEQKLFVWNKMRGKLAELVQEALQAIPS